MSNFEGLERVERRLATRAPLREADRSAIRALPFTCRTLEPSAYIVREGAPAQACVLLLAGFAFRHKVTGNGQRQIISVNLPGEFVDLQNCFFDVADHNVQTLTRCDIGSIPTSAIRTLIEAHPLVAQAMWIDTLIESAIFREWIVNVGRRDSIGRIAHLLCEFALRLEVGGPRARPSLRASDYPGATRRLHRPHPGPRQPGAQGAWRPGADRSRQEIGQHRRLGRASGDRRFQCALSPPRRDERRRPFSLIHGVAGRVRSGDTRLAVEYHPESGDGRNVTPRSHQSPCRPRVRGA